MATSGNKTVEIFSWIDLKFSWWENSQSIENNTTNVGWKLELICGNGSLSKKNRTWTVTIDGNKQTGTVDVNVSKNTTQTLASGTANVIHTADGTKTFPYSFSQQFELTLYNGSYMSTYSGSGDGTLDTIPRASSFGTITGNTLGSNMTVNISRNSTSFTHQLLYKLGNSNWYNLGTGITTSKTFAPDINLCSQLPNATSGTLQLCLKTYSGTTQIGADVYKNVAVNVPSNLVPTISSVTIAEASNIVPSGFPYVQNKSKLKILVSASGIYGSTITSKSVLDGVTYTGTNITTNIISSLGEISLVTTVTDSRGRTATKTDKINVFAYSPPTVTASLIRCDSAGNEHEQGEYMKVFYNLSVLPLNTANTKTFKIQYKKSTSTTYTTDTINATSYNTSGEKIYPAESGSSYDVIVSATDSFAQTKKNLVLSTAFTIFNIRADGKGIKFGGVAERDGFEIAQDFFVGGGNSMFNPKRVLNGTDFNDLLQVGWYMQESNANTSENINAPEKVAFLLCTYKMTDTRLMQHFICLDGKASYWRYYRDWEPAGWIEWHQMTGEATINYVNSNANYLCKKYSDGTMEISGGMDISAVACNTALGGWYRSNVLTPPTYIQNFAAIPDVCISFSTAAGTGAMVWETNGGSVSVPPTFYLIRPTSSSSVSGRISIIAKGRWK